MLCLSRRLKSDQPNAVRLARRVVFFFSFPFLFFSPLNSLSGNTTLALQPRSAKDAVMAIGCHPPTEVTEIRRASGGMLRAHVNPWQLLAPSPFTLPSRDCASLARNRVMRCVKLGGGGCSEHRFIPAPPSAMSPV